MYRAPLHSLLSTTPYTFYQSQQVTASLGRHTPQGLSNILNSLAKFSHDPGSKFWERLALRVDPHHDDDDGTSGATSTVPLALLEVCMYVCMYVSI